MQIDAKSDGEDETEADGPVVVTKLQHLACNIIFDFCKSQNKNPNEVLSALILIHLKKKVSNE